jgi:hypothetical protein
VKSDIVRPTAGAIEALIVGVYPSSMSAGCHRLHSTRAKKIGDDGASSVRWQLMLSRAVIPLGHGAMRSCLIRLPLSSYRKAGASLQLELLSAKKQLRRRI